MLLHIDVINKVATYQKRDGCIVCGNSGYQIEFNFDNEWLASAYKTARFIWGGRTVDVPFDGAVCDVPIISNAEKVIVGVFTNDHTTATTATEIPCKKSILCT